MTDERQRLQLLLTASEEEFQRLILDIHDQPVQKLFAALAQLTLLHSRLSDLLPEQPEILATLQRASELLESALSDIRNLLSTFRTPEFTHRKLDQIIEDLIVQFETLTGLKVNLVQKEVPEGIALPVKIAVYRIVQEALSNVYRHAGVNEAWVSLYQQGNHLRLEIRDQGHGFAPATEEEGHPQQGKHLGLEGMRERVALLNGRLWIESQTGKGTSVSVEIPLHE